MKKILSLLLPVVGAVCSYRVWFSSPVVVPTAEKRAVAGNPEQNSGGALAKKENSRPLALEQSEAIPLPAQKDEELLAAADYAAGGDQEFIYLLQCYRDKVQAAQFESDVAKTARALADRTKAKEDADVAAFSEVKAKHSAIMVTSYRQYIGQAIRRKTNRPNQTPTAAAGNGSS